MIHQALAVLLGNAQGNHLVINGQNKDTSRHIQKYLDYFQQFHCTLRIQPVQIIDKNNDSARSLFHKGMDRYLKFLCELFDILIKTAVQIK